MPTELVTDGFARDDAPDLGANWTVLFGSLIPGVVSQCAKARGGGVYSAVYTGALWTGGADQYAQVYTASDGAGYHRIYVRGSTTESTVYSFRVTHGSTTASLYKTVAGVSTQIGTDITLSTACDQGDLIRLEVTGNALTCKHNGETVRTDTDGDIATGYPGIGVTNYAVVDGFSAGSQDSDSVEDDSSDALLAVGLTDAPTAQITVTTGE